MRAHAKYIARQWCGLRWTPWVPFSQEDFSVIPTYAGVYRVRPRNGHTLVYIGQTGRSLRGRLMTLRNYTMRRQMPYNDPHTAAPNLWAWRISDGMEFECSAAPCHFSKRKRLGVESYLLCQYRLERGGSPLCNLGRFHPKYSRPGNRSTGRGGLKLPKAKSNPAGGVSAPPLQRKGSPPDANWMGLKWVSAEGQATAGAGLYKVLDSRRRALVYIGQSKNLRARLLAHRSSKRWAREGSIWVAIPRVMKLNHHRLELENDLLGSFYELFKDVPKYQAGKGKG